MYEVINAITVIFGTHHITEENTIFAIKRKGQYLLVILQFNVLSFNEDDALLQEAIRLLNVHRLHLQKTALYLK